MTEFRRTCQQCFQEDGLTIALVREEEEGEWKCPKNSNHETELDMIIA